MTSTYTLERSTIGAFLEQNWTACPIEWPDTQYTRPTPSADPTQPQIYMAFEVDYRRAKQITMDGDAQIDGDLDFAFWVQADAGDEPVRTLMDSLRSLLLAARPISGILWVFEPMPLRAAVDGAWYGRGLSFPFTRFVIDS